MGFIWSYKLKCLPLNCTVKSRQFSLVSDDQNCQKGCLRFLNPRGLARQYWGNQTPKYQLEAILDLVSVYFKGARWDTQGVNPGLKFSLFLELCKVKKKQGRGGGEVLNHLSTSWPSQVEVSQPVKFTGCSWIWGREKERRRGNWPPLFLLTKRGWDPPASQSGGGFIGGEERAEEKDSPNSLPLEILRLGLASWSIGGRERQEKRYLPTTPCLETVKWGWLWLDAWIKMIGSERGEKMRKRGIWENSDWPATCPDVPTLSA